MQSHMLVGGVLAASFCFSLAFGACRTGAGKLAPTATSTPSSASALASAPQVPATSAQNLSSAQAAVVDSGTSDAEKWRTEVSKARACTAPNTAILNHPDGGVVFNNAMTSADAGFIDRTQATLDAIAAQASSFVCCFDVWTKLNPSKEGAIMLRVTLAPDGDVREAKVDPQRSSVAEPLTVACVEQVAASIDYPASPTGKQTVVEYPFKFNTLP